MTSCIAAMLGIGLTIVPWLAAQTPVVEQQTAVSGQVAAIPPDQQPTKEQLAKLFEAMRLREQLQDYFTKMDATVQEQALPQYREVFKKLCGDCKLTSEQYTAIDKIMNKYVAKLVSAYSVDERVADICATYQRHLNRTDVDALLAFYSSPAGKHLLDEKPAIMQEYMAHYMKRMQESRISISDEMAREMLKVIDPTVRPRTSRSRN